MGGEGRCLFQREVPEYAQSRVASYDAFGSFVLNPMGAAIAGPLAATLGTSEALWLAAAAIVASNLSMLLIPAGLEGPGAQLADARLNRRVQLLAGRLPIIGGLAAQDPSVMLSGARRSCVVRTLCTNSLCVAALSL